MKDTWRQFKRWRGTPRSRQRSLSTSSIERQTSTTPTQLLHVERLNQEGWANRAWQESQSVSNYNITIITNITNITNITRTNFLEFYILKKLSGIDSFWNTLVQPGRRYNYDDQTKTDSQQLIRQEKAASSTKFNQLLACRLSIQKWQLSLHTPVHHVILLRRKRPN